MNRMFFAITGLILPLTLFAQEYEFEYHKNKNLVYLQSPEVTYEYRIDQTNSAGLQSTSVQTQDGSYRLLTRRGQYGTVRKVLDSKDSLLATLFITGEKANNILLPDGRMLQFKRVTSHTWSYLYNSKEVVTYDAKQKDGRKRVVIQYSDPSFNLDAIELICLDHGRTKLKANPAFALIAVSALTTVILTVASRENDKTTLP